MARPRLDARGPTARQRIVEAADRLFYRKGIPHVGVNELVDRSGIAKMTLYRHFASKDDIVVEALEQRRGRRENQWQKATAHATSPRARVLAAFDLLDELLRSGDFRGCAFINAAVETGDRDHPAFQLAKRYKQEISERFRGIAAAAGWKRPALFGQQCLILWDGAIVSAFLLGDRKSARVARAMASALIDGHA